MRLWRKFMRNIMPKNIKINVNFMARDGRGIAIRTYERGVEDETLACGTGSVASAIVASRVFGLQSPVLIRTRSGVALSVAFRAFPDRIGEVVLEGPVERVFEGRLEWAG